MQKKPDNWHELSIDEKREMRLDAWVDSAEHIRFESPETKQSYIERITLFRDAVEMKKAPARVPVSPMAGGFAMQLAGLHQIDAMYDRWEDVGEAIVQFQRDYEPDTSSFVFFYVRCRNGTPGNHHDEVAWTRTSKRQHLPSP